MSMPTVSNDLDFQTVFQILLAFEGFSIWKAKSFLVSNPIADLREPESINYGTVDTWIERFKESHSTWTLIITGILNLKTKFGHGVKSFGKVCARGMMRFLKWLYFALSGCLEYSPFFSIPAFSLLYFFQWGCSKDTTSVGRFVFWYLCGKTLLYVVRAVLYWILKHRIGVKTDVVGNNIITPSSLPPPSESSPPP